MELLDNPITNVPCGHSFCKKCIPVEEDDDYGECHKCK